MRSLPYWQFTAILDEASVVTDALSDSVFQALGQDSDCLCACVNGVCQVDVGREAASLDNAIRRTIDALCEQGIKVTKIEIGSAGLADLPETSPA